MSRKTIDWNEGLAEDLKDPAFATEFIMGALEEGATIQEVLSKVIRLHGAWKHNRQIFLGWLNCQHV